MAESTTAVYVLNQTDNTVSVVDTSSLNVIDTIAVSDSPYYASPHISEDGSTLAFASYNSNAIDIIKTSDNSHTTVTTGYSALSCALSPDGSRIYYGLNSSFAPGAGYTNTADGSAGPSLTGSSLSGVQSIAISADGSQLYIGGEDLEIIDTATWAVTATYNPSNSMGRDGLAISPDGSTLYLCCGSDGVVAYDIATGTGTNVYSGMEADNGLLSPDGDLLAIYSSTNHRMQVLNTTTWSVNGSLTIVRPSNNNAGSFWSFSPDSSKLAVTSSYGSYEFIVLSSADLSIASQAALSSPQAVAISADGATAYVSSNGVLSVYDIASGAVTSTVTIGSGSGPLLVANVLVAQHLSITLTDAISTSGTINRLGSFARVHSEAILGRDDIGRILTATRAKADALTTSDSTASRLAYMADLTAASRTSSTLSSLWSASRLLSHTSSVVESLTRSYAGSRTVLDAFSFASFVARYQPIGVHIFLPISAAYAFALPLSSSVSLQLPFSPRV